MSEQEPEQPAPPPGEHIHLPGPSILPLITGVGITLLVIGITTYIELTIVGFVVTVICAIRWITDTRRETDELPSESSGHSGH